MRMQQWSSLSEKLRLFWLILFVRRTSTHKLMLPARQTTDRQAESASVRLRTTMFTRSGP